MAQLKDLLVNGSARVIGSLFANLSGNVLNFGVCSTAAATAAKTVTTNGTFELITGSKILVLFSETDTSNAPTLNVNGTGAKSIKVNANDGIGKGFLAAQLYYWFIYDGTNWRTAGAGITLIIPTQYGGTGNSSYIANRIIYSNTATKLASGTVTTDGAYLSNISYLSVNRDHLTDYRLWVNGFGCFEGNLTLYSTSGDSPSLIFNRKDGLTDWRIYVTGGLLSFASATNASTWTRRAYFLDGSGTFVPGDTNTYDLGSSSLKWRNIYATTLNGNLAKKLTIQANGTQKGLFNNSADVTVNLGNVVQDLTGANSGNAVNINADTFASMTKQQWLNTVYPVGSIYMSVNSTSPATLFGGTWESLGGRFLIGQDGTYTAGSTGGSATHTHTIAHTHTMAHTHTISHTHTMAHTHALVATTSGGPSNNTSGGTAITVAQMPAHSHLVSNMAIGWSGWQDSTSYETDKYSIRFSDSAIMNPPAYGGPTEDRALVPNGIANNTGSGLAHTHTLSSHTHTTAATTTGGASNATTSAASTSTSGAASNATTSAASAANSGSASTLPPYLAVYMWKRTA